MAASVSGRALRMRRAAAGDEAAVAQLIRDRSAWMREHGLPDWENAADDLASQATVPQIPVWVLTAGDEVLGCTTLLTESPSWLWSEQERAEPALFLAGTATHPRYAGQRLGCVIAWWALVHAARTGHRWVRRATFVPELARYYCDVQGWQVIRQVPRDGVTVVALARGAARDGAGVTCSPAPAVSGGVRSRGITRRCGGASVRE